MLRRLLSRLSTVVLMAGALIMTGSCAREPAPGEVMLLVSTDLSTATDVDTLRVTVTRNGQSDTDQCFWLRDLPPGTTPVCPAASLPGTIALVSNDAKSGQAHVHLELLRGGAKGSVLVQRDAELQIPNEGVKQLPMALNFLCLEANLPAACQVGTSCEAGRCVADQVGQFADYVATSPPNVCFDVTNCFNAGNVAFPLSDETGCTIGGTDTFDAVNVNVALVVNPAQAGNFGVCDSNSGKCLVPLDHGPDGWTTLTNSKGVAAGIVLPQAVCAGVPASLLGVVVGQSGSCGVKNSSLGACQSSPICIEAAGICPEKWSGLSCSGDASPDSAPSEECGQVHADPTTGPLVPGLWCCGSGIVKQDNELLIDDMSSGPLIKLQPSPGYLPGGWFTFSDDRNAVISPSPRALFSYRNLDPAVTLVAGAAPISHAACLRSDGIEGFIAGEGFDLLRDPRTHFSAPLDVAPYTGIRFWAASVPPAKGKLNLPTQIRVQIPNADTWELNSNSTCVQERETCGDYFGQAFTLPEDGSWAPYIVSWTDLQQEGWGKAYTPFNTHVNNVTFAFKGPGPDAGTRSLPFDFCVAQIEFTRD